MGAIRFSKTKKYSDKTQKKLLIGIGLKILLPTCLYSTKVENYCLRGIDSVSEETPVGRGTLMGRNKFLVDS
jgi:hypothetical protein